MNPVRHLRLLSVAAASWATLFAQVKPTPVAETTKSTSSQPTKNDARLEQAVEMEPFAITSRREGGYVADSSVAATRFVAPLKTLPVNVQVFTQEFIEDVNESDMRNLLVYSAGTTGPVSQNLRSFSNQEKLKDGFKMSAFFDYPADAFQRLEIVKGPSAVIFGRSEPGGITNYVSKKPIFGQRFMVTSVGTGVVNGFYRYKGMVDINSELNKNFAYRFVGHYTDREDFVQGTPHAALRHGKTTNTLFYPSFTWQIDSSTKLFLSYMYVDNPIFSQIGRGNPSSILVVGANNLQTPLNVAFPQFHLHPYTDDYGAGRRFFYKYSDYTAVFDHTFSETLSMRAGLSVHSRDRGDPFNTTIAFANVGGVPGVRRTFNYNRFTALLPDMQVYALWKPIENHTFSIGLSRNITNEKSNIKLSSRAPNGTFSNGGFSEFFPLGGPLPTGYPNDINLGPATLTDVKGVFDTDYVNYFGSFAENRLHVLGAAAYNRYDETDNLLKRTNVDVSKVGHQFGVLYEITKNVGLFGLTSSSMQFSAARDGFDRSFGPLFGEGLEGGAKFEFFGGKFTGTATYYRTVNKNQIVFDSFARNTAYDASTAAGAPNATLLGANVQAGEITVSGVEVDFAANVGRNWSLQFSLSHLSAETTKAPAGAAAAVRKGIEPNGTTPNAVSIFARYSFTEGALKGFYVGTGLIWKGQSNSGLAPGSTTLYVYNPYYLALNPLAGYRTRLFGVPAKFQLNIKDALQHANLHTGFNPATGERFHTYIPRFIKFDITLEF